MTTAATVGGSVLSRLAGATVQPAQILTTGAFGDSAVRVGPFEDADRTEWALTAGAVDGGGSLIRSAGATEQLAQIGTTAATVRSTFDYLTSTSGVDGTCNVVGTGGDDDTVGTAV